MTTWQWEKPKNSLVSVLCLSVIRCCVDFFFLVFSIVAGVSDAAALWSLFESIVQPFKKKSQHNTTQHCSIRKRSYLILVVQPHWKILCYYLYFTSFLSFSPCLVACPWPVPSPSLPWFMVIIVAVVLRSVAILFPLRRPAHP